MDSRASSMHMFAVEENVTV